MLHWVACVTSAEAKGADSVAATMARRSAGYTLHTYICKLHAKLGGMVILAVKENYTRLQNIVRFMRMHFYIGYPAPTLQLCDGQISFTQLSHGSSHWTVLLH